LHNIASTQESLRHVRYDDINIRLLNEFLKEHRRVEEQQAKVEEQQAIIAFVLVANAFTVSAPRCRFF
jgi:hypothetical protein